MSVRLILYQGIGGRGALGVGGWVCLVFSCFGKPPTPLEVHENHASPIPPPMHSSNPTAPISIPTNPQGIAA